MIALREEINRSIESEAKSTHSTNAGAGDSAGRTSGGHVPIAAVSASGSNSSAFSTIQKVKEETDSLERFAAMKSYSEWRLMTLAKTARKQMLQQMPLEVR